MQSRFPVSVEQLRLSLMEYGRIIIPISLLETRLWSNHLKMEHSDIFLIP